MYPWKPERCIQDPQVESSHLFMSVFIHQRKAKYSENKLKTLKARNEYLLTLEATNASVFKYYIHDLPDIIDVSIHVWHKTSVQLY